MKAKLELTEKAYQIDLHRLNEGYLHSPYICYAETIGKAKSKLLSEVFDCENVFGDEITYLNVPVIRRKESDKFLFEDRTLTLWKINEIKEERIRNIELDKILSDINITYCYVRKGNYYKPNSSGYTDYKHRAGVYTKQEAVSHARHCSDINLEVINIAEHNSLLQKEIDNISTRIIK